MCVKSGRHVCLQSFLILLLTLSLLLFSAVVTFDLAVYFLSDSATVLQRPESPEVPLQLSSQIAPLPDPEALVDEQGPSVADQLADHVLRSNCSLVGWVVHSGHSLHVCASQPTRSRPSEFVQCFRETLLYKGLLLLLPLLLVLLTLVAVCRLWLCPVMLLALLYLLLAVGLVAGVVLYESGRVISQDLPLFGLVLFLVALYAILSLLLVLLFALVRTERRRRRADHEKMVKTDDEDEIDDPNAPLYKNNISPQKKNDFEEKIKEFKFIDDDMSYVFRRG